MRQVTQLAFLTQSFCLTNIEANSVWQGVL